MMIGGEHRVTNAFHTLTTSTTPPNTPRTLSKRTSCSLSDGSPVNGETETRRICDQKNKGENQLYCLF